MIEIKDLLLKTQNDLSKEEFKKEVVRSVISDSIKISIKSEDVKIKNGTIYLNIKPIYKNEILFKKDEIFSKIKELLLKKAPEKFL